MKRLLLVLFALTFAAGCLAQVPGVKLEDHKGRQVESGKAILDGKTPVIVSFWRSDCIPCIKELSAIYDALPDWQEKADFRVVAVSTDDSRSIAKARSMAQGKGWTDDYVLLYDLNQDFARAMNVTLTPQTFIFDGKGKLVYSHTGYTPGSESELLKEILKLK